MSRFICILFLLFSCHICLCQEQNTKKLQFGVFAGMQLSSTKWNACIIAKTYYNKNIFYVGAKTPISANNIYTSFPVGVMAGYGYKLFENKNWSMAPLLDIQWLDSKTQHQSKPTHYFDFSLNYQLSFIRWKKIQLNSSFGYGCFIKRFYNTYFTNWEKSYGISGLISLGIEYVF